jgi:hypothetical protein
LAKEEPLVKNLVCERNLDILEGVTAATENGTELATKTVTADFVREPGKNIYLRPFFLRYICGGIKTTLSEKGEGRSLQWPSLLARVVLEGDKPRALSTQELRATAGTSFSSSKRRGFCRLRVNNNPKPARVS